MVDLAPTLLRTFEWEMNTGATWVTRHVRSPTSHKNLIDAMPSGLVIYHKRDGMIHYSDASLHSFLSRQNLLESQTTLITLVDR